MSSGFTPLRAACQRISPSTVVGFSSVGAWVVSAAKLVAAAVARSRATTYLKMVVR
jgi:uncharacterized protein (UPF0548 family)